MSQYNTHYSHLAVRYMIEWQFVLVDDRYFRIGVWMELQFGH